MKDSRKFIIKAFIFAIPFILYFSNNIRNLFLPFDSYAFRGWESLVVFKQNGFLSGPFYPNAYLEVVEQGDMPVPEELRILKDVTWITDKYGFRKKEKGQGKQDIVIIGDSFTAGASLTQSDMFSEKLESKLNLNVYPYAPANFTEFIEDPRFVKNPPDIVIFEAAEKIVRHVPYVGVGGKKPPGVIEKYLATGKFISGVDRLAVAYDRYLKHSFLHFAYARIYEYPGVLAKRYLIKSTKVPQKTVEEEVAPTNLSDIANLGYNISTDGKVAFNSQADDKYIEWTEVEMGITTDTIDNYRKYIEGKGMRFIFLPIPNKENIYYAVSKGGIKMHSLEILISELEKRGVEVVDLQSAYNKAYKEHPEKLLYHPDDSHWTPYGVDIAVDLLESTVREKK